MRRYCNRMRSAAFLALFSVGLSGCGSSAPRHASAASRPPTSALGARRCAVSALRLSVTHAISPATDEGGREFALINTSDAPCVLSVSPRRVVLSDNGQRMPFGYSYGIPRGGGLETPTRRLRPALLLPSTAAYFSATKQECVAKTSGVATELRVFLPGSPTPLKIAFPNDGGYGVSNIRYCLPELSGRSPAPGDLVSVSPIERRPPACIREPENPNETEHESERRNRECETEDKATVESYRLAGARERPAWEEARSVRQRRRRGTDLVKGPAACPPTEPLGRRRRTPAASRRACPCTHGSASPGHRRLRRQSSSR